MSKIRQLYKKYIYGIMGTLIFHIIVISSFLIAEINFKGQVKEDVIIIDFPFSELKVEPVTKQTQQKGNIPSNQEKNLSNRPVNDAMVNDPFFDHEYKKEIQSAKEIVEDVNKQLSKEIPDSKKFKMPVEKTEGIHPDSVKNTIYSGKSNIHYRLEDRFHVQLPIPVYLAKGGGIVKVEIEVNRQGNVTKAQVKEAGEMNDPMLPQYALEAALNTLFNPNPKAPVAQHGLITYTFVPQ